MNTVCTWLTCWSLKAGKHVVVDAECAASRHDHAVVDREPGSRPAQVDGGHLQHPRRRHERHRHGPRHGSRQQRGEREHTKGRRDGDSLPEERREIGVKGRSLRSSEISTASAAVGEPHRGGSGFFSRTLGQSSPGPGGACDETCPRITFRREIRRVERSARRSPSGCDLRTSTSPRVDPRSITSESSTLRIVKP